MSIPIKLVKFCALTGYTEDAVYSKIKRGDWQKNIVYYKAPDGSILIIPEGYKAWANGSVMKASGQGRGRASRSTSSIAANDAESELNCSPHPLT